MDAFGYGVILIEAEDCAHDLALFQLVSLNYFNYLLSFLALYFCCVFSFCCLFLENFFLFDQKAFHDSSISIDLALVLFLVLLVGVVVLCI